MSEGEAMGMWRQWQGVKRSKMHAGRFSIVVLNSARDPSYPDEAQSFGMLLFSVCSFQSAILPSISICCEDCFITKKARWEWISVESEKVLSLQKVLLCQIHTYIHTASVKREDEDVWHIRNCIPKIASTGAIFCIIICSQDDSSIPVMRIWWICRERERELCLMFFLSGQQLHPECDTGAGHPAGPKPRIAPSLHHAGHWCHEETGMYLLTVCIASLFIPTL